MHVPYGVTEQVNQSDFYPAKLCASVCRSGKQGVRFQGEGSRLFWRHRHSGLGGFVCVEMLIKKLIPYLKQEFLL